MVNFPNQEEKNYAAHAPTSPSHTVGNKGPSTFSLHNKKIQKRLCILFWISQVIILSTNRVQNLLQSPVLQAFVLVGSLNCFGFRINIGSRKNIWPRNNVHSRKNIGSRRKVRFPKNIWSRKNFKSRKILGSGQILGLVWFGLVRSGFVWSGLALSGLVWSPLV